MKQKDRGEKEEADVIGQEEVNNRKELHCRGGGAPSGQDGEATYRCQPKKGTVC